MSPTTEQLRSRMAHELDELGPVPDLSRAAAREGSRVLRRRRLATGSLVGVAGVGACSLLGAVAAGALPGSDGKVADDPTPSPVPSFVLTPKPVPRPIHELVPTVPPYPTAPLHVVVPGLLPTVAPTPTPTSVPWVRPTSAPPAPTPTSAPSVRPTAKPPAPTPTMAPTNRGPDRGSDQRAHGEADSGAAGPDPETR